MLNSKHYNQLTQSDDETKDNQIQDNVLNNLNNLNDVNIQNKQIYADNIMNNILECAGYNKLTLKVTFLVFMILHVEGLEMTLFSSIVIPLQKFYQLSDTTVSIISCLLFIGVGLGSIASGTFSEKYGRRFIINFFLSILTVLNLIMGRSSDYIIFTTCRFFIGFCIGVVVPMSLNLMAEYLPLKFRSFVLTCVWVGFSVGCLFFQGLMLYIMPNLEITKVNETIMWSTLLPLLTLIFTLTMLDDSPRSLILRSEYKQAVKILEQIKREKMEENEIKELIQQVKTGANGDMTRNITELFNKKFMMLTFLLCLIWFINSLVTYGPLLVSTNTLYALGQNSTDVNKDIIINQIIITLINLPSNFFGGILSEISALGRNKSTILNFILAIVTLSLLLIFPQYFTVFFGLSGAFLGIAFNINTTYSCEVYPTKIRDQALGFLFFSTRVGGVVSQLVYLGINSIGVFVPYYFTLILTCLNVVLVYLLPFDTCGMPLDIEFPYCEDK